MIYVVSADSLENCFEELTDKEFIKLAGDWKFKDWNSFMEEFNNNGDFAPYPSEHYIREIK